MEIVVKTDGRGYELLRIIPDEPFVSVDLILVQACTAAGFDPNMMILKGEHNEIIEDYVKAGTTVYLFSKKGCGEPVVPKITIQIAYKTDIIDCPVTDVEDLDYILMRGCTIYGLDPQKYYVEPCERYFLLREKKRGKLEERDRPRETIPVASVTFPIPPPVPDILEDVEIRGIVHVRLPDGTPKKANVKNTTLVRTVLLAVCTKMNMECSKYTIEPDPDGFVEFDKLYEIKEKK
jgi:hypothetical protein